MIPTELLIRLWFLSSLPSLLFPFPRTTSRSSFRRVSSSAMDMKIFSPPGSLIGEISFYLTPLSLHSEWIKQLLSLEFQTMLFTFLSIQNWRQFPLVYQIRIQVMLGSLPTLWSFLIKRWVNSTRRNQEKSFSLSRLNPCIGNLNLIPFLLHTTFTFPF